MVITSFGDKRKAGVRPRVSCEIEQDKIPTGCSSDLDVVKYRMKEARFYNLINVCAGKCSWERERQKLLLGRDCIILIKLFE